MHVGLLIHRDRINLKQPHRLRTNINALSTEGYSESSVSILTEALETCLRLHNETEPSQLNLVFFEEAVRHIARLTRVLVSHQVLLPADFGLVALLCSKQCFYNYKYDSVVLKVV